jgi:ATP/maltotriose-dependent transcriptional regulator MalT
MDTLLLATKLRIPPQPHHVVPRTRLIDAIERGIPQHKLILLSAPAGYGKTTLLSQWAHVSRFPIAWLSLGQEDNDLDRLFRYLCGETLKPTDGYVRILRQGGADEDHDSYARADHQDSRTG